MQKQFLVSFKQFKKMSSAAEVVNATRNAFKTGITKPVDWRIAQLRKLHEMLVKEEDAFVNALYDDLRKSKHESLMLEIIVTKNEAISAIKNLYSWAAPTYASKSTLQMLDTMYIQKDPLGVALIIGAWNYPIQLTLAPLIAAIASGNCVVLKPSEISANTAATLTKLLPKYLDNDCFKVFNGGIPETTLLLEQRFDFILYTGSSQVGKIVMSAAAKHLTPVLLEMGGKSPVYVDNNVHMHIVARRIAWGKLCNSGQTCVAPDYVLCHQSVLEHFLSALKVAIEEMVGENPKESPDYGRIVSDRNFARIRKIIDAMPEKKLYLGGGNDSTDRYIAPTVYRDVSLDDEVMKSEIFGPLLPVVTVSSKDEAIDIINGSEKPLALYIFSNTTKVVDDILAKTSCGGVCVNDTFMHCSSHNMPFGGVGESGMGRYHGKWGFDAMTHEKPVCWRKQNMESLLTSRYMPYSTSKTNMLNTLTCEKERGYCAIM